MQDEQFMRQWNDDHGRFSADLDRGLGHILRRFAHRREDRSTIGSSYGFLTRYAEPKQAAPALSAAARASLRGFAASVITVALWVVVMVVATPAPGLASPVHASAAQVIYPALA